MRLAIAFAAIIAIPTYLLIDLYVACQRGWWSSSSLHHGLVGLCIAIQALAVAVVLWPRTRKVLSNRWRAVLLALGTTAVSWLAVEVLAGLWLGSTDLFHRKAPGYRHRFEPRPEYMPGITGPSMYTTNSAGLRGPEPPPREEAYRILCVGGSTTACIYVDDSETWTHLLMEKLGAAREDRPVWSAGAGLNGAASREHVRLMEDASLLREMDCAVFLVGVNDVIRTLLGLPGRGSFGVSPVFESSNLYAILRRGYDARKARKDVVLIETDDGSSYVARRDRRIAAGRRVDIPDLTPGLADFEYNIRTIVAACRDQDVVPVFATQPVLWSPDLSPEAERSLWQGALPDGRYLATPALAECMRTFNDTLTRVCRELGVTVIDLTSMSGDTRYFYDDCHFTEAGGRRVAELMAEVLASAPL